MLHGVFGAEGFAEFGDGSGGAVGVVRLRGHGESPLFFLLASYFSIREIEKAGRRPDVTPNPLLC